jgi:hypothetical protein
MNLEDIQFNRPDLGSNKFETNQGLLILHVPCAMDFYKLQQISKEHEGIDKFLFFTEYLAESIGGDPVTIPVLMKLDGESLNKLITHFTELMLALVPQLSDEAKKMLEMM